MQSAGNIQLSGVMSLVRKILIGTLIFEGAGAFLLAFRFCPLMGWKEGIFNAIFHSVSAFCNAGFDLMGKYEAFSSLTLFYDDLFVQIVVMSLVIIGGIGFFVWSDILKCGKHFKQYTLHTKMVLISTAVLLLAGWISFFFLEYDGALEGLTFNEKILASLFQSVTTRTAGFNTIDQSNLTGGGLLSIVLMLIGGSPGSTAGGIKTVTVLVTLLSAIATISRRENSVIFKKRLNPDTVQQASAISTIYIVLVIISTIAIMKLETVDLEQALFETSSAIGTVGITMGMTPSIGVPSKIILMLLMFIGRVGGLSFILAFSAEKVKPDIQRPTEKVMIG
jgi:trk system potassium uptake protein TrkH